MSLQLLVYVVSTNTDPNSTLSSENIDATAHSPLSMRVEPFKDRRRVSSASTPVCYSESTIHRK